MRDVIASLQTFSSFRHAYTAAMRAAFLSAPCTCVASRATSPRQATAALPTRRSVATRAIEFDSDTLTIVLAAVAGVGLGIGAPVFYAQAEKRDKERIEAIRQMNRANLKATGQLLSDVRSL